MTAVEFLAQNLKRYSFIDKDKARIEMIMLFELWNEIVDKALEMEKQQIEISDEDIYHKADCYSYKYRDDSSHDAFIIGSKWYKEQLKLNNKS